MSEQPTRPRIPAEKLVLGLVLVTVGTLSAFDLFEHIHWRNFWRYWAVIPLILGVLSEINSLQTRKSEGGYVLIAFGTWMLIGGMNLWDLTYRSAFPIGVVIVGLGMIVHALIDRPATKLKVNGHEQ